MVSLYIIEAYLNTYIDELNFSTMNRIESIDLILTTCKLIIEYLNDNLLEFCYSDKLDDLYENIKKESDFRIVPTLVNSKRFSKHNDWYKKLSLHT